MKLKKFVRRIMAIALLFAIGIGATKTFAETSPKTFVGVLSRYINNNGVYTPSNIQYSFAEGKYYQLISKNTTTGQTTGINYYCLDARAGVWNTDSNITTTAVTYKNNVDFDKTSDLDTLNKTEGTYQNIANQKHYKELLWIMNNMYVYDKNVSAEENLKRKEALLAKAGIVKKNIDSIDTYVYSVENSDVYDSTNYPKFVNHGNNAYEILDSENHVKPIILSDDLVDVVQQAALWYFTNEDIDAFKDVYTALNRTTTNNWLIRNDGTSSVVLFDYNKEKEEGEMLQEQASILVDYLIDGAKKAAESTDDVNNMGNPLKINGPTTNIDSTTIPGKYIIGPIKIEKQGNAVYKFNEMLINDSQNSNAYIALDSNGTNSHKNVSEVVGENFYVVVPSSDIKGSSVTIRFKETYNTNKKTLWVDETQTQQPIIEITPEQKNEELKITATLEKQFDLALRKSIAKITDKNGVTKSILGEDKKDATRKITYVSDDIKTNGTATYKHRKDPVVVKKGDIITYDITIYNEGDIAGYAKKIVDKLPDGLTLHKNAGTTTNNDGTISGSYKSGNIEYSYIYNPQTNEIEFTNKSTNVLNAYSNEDGATLSSEKIEIECEVVQEPSKTENTYLTNIAYILKEYNAEKNEEVEEDRDSKTFNQPTTNQKTTGNKYTGYKGSSNITDVYQDKNNELYYKGEEDDDDFEIVVVEPAEFDLKLMKYISAINGKESGRKIEVDTTELDSGKSTTAKYNVSKNPLTVKTGDYVTYTFNIYNEGDIDGYASEITEDIPEGLEYVYDTNIIENVDGTLDYSHTTGLTDQDKAAIEFNRSMMWSWTLENNKITKIKTDILSHSNTINSLDEPADYAIEKYPYLAGDSNLIKAYDPSVMKDGPHYRQVSVMLKVVATSNKAGVITNNAAITEDQDKDGKTIDDRDSDSDENNKKEENWKKENSTEYYDNDTNYPKYKEDDEDYDNIILEKIDLALTKFIVAVSDRTEFTTTGKFIDGEYLTKDGTSKNAGTESNQFTRQTIVNTNPLKQGKNDAEYTLVKGPLTIPERAYVLYNIRVYNEGDTDVYAGKVTDYLPNYLDFVKGDFNDQYGWEADGKKVTTTYLAHTSDERVNENKKLKAFDKVKDQGNGEGLDYKDLPILCRVNNEAPENTKLINSAEITKYEDENGNEIPKEIGDVDSKPENLNENKNKEGKPEGRYDEDDEDYEVVIIEKKKIDLALTKFIVAVSDRAEFTTTGTFIDGEYLTKDGTSKNAGSESNPFTRQTKVNTNPLKQGKNDAEYTLVKDPHTIPERAYVLYNIRVYNEGETDVYAGEVTDYLPNYLDFVKGEINDQYGWEADGKKVTTKYLAHTSNAQTNENKKLVAFDKVKDQGNGEGLDYKDLPILCRVNNEAPENTKLINSAEITKYEDENGNEIPKETGDVDSKPENLNENKNKEGKPEGRYDEDDEDYEVVIIKKKKIDLALTKFIAAISSDVEINDGEYLTANKKVGSKDNPYTRATEVDTKNLRDDPNCHDATYTMVKDPLTVPAESYVLYNIRVYNEGETDVYAGEVTDHLPNYLDFVKCDFNTNFGWEVESDGKTIKTKYLSYEKDKNNLLKAFDKVKDDGKGSGLDYKDLQVICKVNNKAPSNKNIVNVAEITKYEDDKGKDITEDVDSKPNNVNEKDEDDDDYEVILIKTFDLSLLKYVSKVIVTEDGVTKTTETKNTGKDTDIIPKVEINRKKINSTVVKFGYTIKVTNEGDIAGYAKEITDYVPDGLKFYEEDNKGWNKVTDKVITTRLLENKLLQPGESATVEVTFRWINGSNNLGLKNNIAEISDDYNDEGVPDRDSTPNNKVEGEDDIDDAQVLLSISTGLVNNIIQFATIGTIILIVIATGIVLIKKFVL